MSVVASGPMVSACNILRMNQVVSEVVVVVVVVVVEERKVR